jgi:WhiB family redox-sensing transcriptional regulator
MIDLDVAPRGGSTSRFHVRTERPAAISSDWEWQLDGACRSGDGELFFHPYGEREPSRSRRERAAQAICAECPVLLPCRAYALAAREAYGVWGGLTETDRVEILASEESAQDSHPQRLREPAGVA